MSTPINSKKRPLETSDLSDQPPAKRIKLEKIKTEKGEGHPLDSSRVADLSPGIASNIENAQKHTTARFQRLTLAVQMGQSSAELCHLLTHIIETMSNTAILQLPISSGTKISDRSMKADIARNYYKFAIAEQIANLEEGRTHTLNELFEQFLGSMDADCLLSLPNFTPSAPSLEVGSDTDDDVVASDVPFDSIGEGDVVDLDEDDDLLFSNVPFGILENEENSIEQSEASPPPVAPAPIAAAPVASDNFVICEAVGVRHDWETLSKVSKAAYDRSQDYIKEQLPGVNLNNPRTLIPALNNRLKELEREAVAKGNLCRHAKTFITFMNQKELWEETAEIELEAPSSPDLRVAVQTSAIFSSTYTASSSTSTAESRSATSSTTVTLPALAPIPSPPSPMAPDENELERAFLAANELFDKRGKKQEGLKAMMAIALKGDLRACRRLAELYQTRKLSPAKLAKNWNALADSDYSVDNLLSLQRAYEKSGFEFAEEVNAITQICAEKNHATSQCACAELFKHKGELETAIYWHKKAFDQLFVSGESHDILTRSILGMLDCYLSLENLDEAYELVDKVRAARTMQSGPVTKQWIDKVIELYTKRAEMEEARKFLIETFTAYQLSESYDANGHALQVAAAAKLVELFERDNLALKAFSCMLPFSNRYLTGAVIDRAPQMRVLAGVLNALIYFEGIKGIARDKLKARNSLGAAIRLLRTSGATSPSCIAEAAGFLTLIDLSLGEHLLNDDTVREEVKKAAPLAIKHGSLIAAHALSNPEHARTITQWGLDAQKSSIAAPSADFSLSNALISHLMRHYGERSFKRDAAETLGIGPIAFVDPGSSSSSSSHTPTPPSSSPSTSSPAPGASMSTEDKHEAFRKMPLKQQLETIFTRRGYDTKDPKKFVVAADRRETDHKLRESAAHYHALIAASDPVFASLKPHTKNSDYLRLATLRHHLIACRFDSNALDEKARFTRAKQTLPHPSIIIFVNEYETLMDKNKLWSEATSTSHLSPPPGMAPPTTLPAAAALSPAARGVAPAAGMISSASFPAAAPAHARRAPGVNSAENIREQFITLFECAPEALMDASRFNELWESERKKLAPTYLPSIMEKVHNYRLKMGWGTPSTLFSVGASSSGAASSTTSKTTPTMTLADHIKLSNLGNTLTVEHKIEIRVLKEKDTFLAEKSKQWNPVILNLLNEYEELMDKYGLWIAERPTSPPVSAPSALPSRGAAPSTAPRVTATVVPEHDHIRLASLRTTLTNVVKVDPRALQEKDVFLQEKLNAKKPEILNILNEYETLMNRNKFWKGSIASIPRLALPSLAKDTLPSGSRPASTTTSPSAPASATPFGEATPGSGLDILNKLYNQLSSRGIPLDTLIHKSAMNAYFKSIPKTPENLKLRQIVALYWKSMETLKKWSPESTSTSTSTSSTSSATPAPLRAMTVGSPEELRHRVEGLLRAGVADIKSVQTLLACALGCEEDKLRDRDFFEREMTKGLGGTPPYLTREQLTYYGNLFRDHMKRLGYWK